MSRGLIYVAHGEGFIKEAMMSALSVKKHCPNMNITLFSDVQLKTELFDNVIVMPKDKISLRGPKIRFSFQSPYDETIFLDTDTIIDHDITEMFDILEKYDFAICHDLARKRETVSNAIPEYSTIPYVFPECNTGVYVFKKNDNVENLFKTWEKYFNKYSGKFPYDQGSFRVAFWECQDVNSYIMPVEYNIRSKMNREKQVKNHHLFGDEHLKPRIYHMHTDPNTIQGKGYSMTSLDEALNYCKKNHMPY